MSNSSKINFLISWLLLSVPFLGTMWVSFGLKPLLDVNVYSFLLLVVVAIAFSSKDAFVKSVFSGRVAHAVLILVALLNVFILFGFSRIDGMNGIGPGLLYEPIYYTTHALLLVYFIRIVWVLVFKKANPLQFKIAAGFVLISSFLSALISLSAEMFIGSGLHQPIEDVITFLLPVFQILGRLSVLGYLPFSFFSAAYQMAFTHSAWYIPVFVDFVDRALVGVLIYFIVKIIVNMIRGRRIKQTQ